LAPNGSIFIVLGKPTAVKENVSGKNWIETKTIRALEGSWNVKFDPKAGGPTDAVTFDELADWSKHADTAIRYYSGTAAYSKTFTWNNTPKQQAIWLDLGNIANIAEVKLNGIACGVAWTPPYRVDITKGLKAGQNKLVIEVSNTWANRLTGDQRLPENKRITKTTAPFRLEGKPLLQAGLLGPVSLLY
jgi:hypothetical protein